MTHHHDHDHHHPKHHEHTHSPKRRGVHKDWRAWLVVILMLAAMWMYLRTMDLSFSPSGEVKPGMPAAPGPPAPTPVGMRPSMSESAHAIGISQVEFPLARQTA